MRPACPTSFQTSTNGPRRKPGSCLVSAAVVVTVTAGYIRNWEMNHNTRHNPCDRGRSWCLGWYTLEAHVPLAAGLCQVHCGKSTVVEADFAPC